MPFTYEHLHDAVTGGAVGLRSRLALQPLGGAGDKVFPPTYGVDTPGASKYAVEDRVLPDGEGGTRRVQSVVLDSVASQANRCELVLLEAVRAGNLDVPVTSVDFAGRGLFGLDRISDYEAPHRIFDALLRDSFDGDHLFRHGAVGRVITEASSRSAAALLRHSPHTLVFGGWDSTGPKGGRGAKYERALTSEIVAHGIQAGVKTSSRIDPAGIELKAGTLYEAQDGTSWTLDQREAVLNGAKPKLYGSDDDKDKKNAGKPSKANHGNVKPSIDATAGGVTAESIVGTVVLSFIQLRRLRFPADADGRQLAPAKRAAAEGVAHTALAALGLAATVLAYEQGFDLRSRCVLVPRGPLALEVVGRAGSVQQAEVDGASALALVAEAADRLGAVGLGWRTGELLLRPSDRLVELIRRSQDMAVAGDESDE